MSGVYCEDCGEWFCDNTAKWSHQDYWGCPGKEGKKELKDNEVKEVKLMDDIEMETLRWRGEALQRAIERGDFNYKITW